MDVPVLTFRDLRQVVNTFLFYQAAQPEGIPLSKRALEQCYSIFITLRPSNVPFSVILNGMHRLHYVYSKRNSDEMVILEALLRILPNTSRTPRGSFYCTTCRVSCTDAASLEAHFRGARHISATRAILINQRREENEMDKEDITITKVEFGKVLLGSEITKTITIRNISHGRTHTLVLCALVKQSSLITISDPQNACAGAIVNIAPGASYNLSISVNALNLGWIRDILVFSFAGDIKIFRYIAINVEAQGSEILAPTSPYQPPNAPHPESPNIIPGEKLPRGPTRGTKFLAKYNIPTLISQQLSDDIPPKLDRLGPDNYDRFFHYLLWFEEYQMKFDIRTYDCWSEMSSHRSFIILRVPGLAENRPSVLVGDSVYVLEGDREYEGVVHMVTKEDVHMKFDQAFHRRFNSAIQYRIRFSFKRTPLRRMHQAAYESDTLPTGFLFPEDIPQDLTLCAQILETSTTLSYINRQINTQQARAVAAIIHGHSRPSPYVVFGPPGTGKTMTIVEAIGQIYTRAERSRQPVRILACAPSNTAADLIAERLISERLTYVRDRKHIFRFNAFNRPFDLTPLEIRAISLSHGETFVIPTKQELEARKIIVSTCMNAGYLSSLNVAPFTHIFIDEAGQAMEPECLVALSTLVSPKTIVVLAGDPKQLGPVIRSPHAQRNDAGLSRSLLERLLATHPYRRDPVAFSLFGNYDMRLITKLIDNYRSHPEILAIPNELFYDNELKALADPALRSALCNWDGLKRQGFPIIFHGIEGKDEREGNSPSWFNVAEAMQVELYIRKLRDWRAQRITAKDIGVITPYRKQAQKLRNLLSGRQHGDIKVGSVEEFQGQERLIIIISCVRSNEQFLNFDLQHNLGFLRNPKRFNVSITRAQALLIVIGNPHVLVHDKNWARLINHCRDNDAYTGCDPPRSNIDGSGGPDRSDGSEGSVDQLIASMGRLQVDENGRVAGISLVEGMHGPEWRRE